MNALQDSSGVIRAIAFRPNEGAAMQLLNECQVMKGQGLPLEGRKPGKRNVTLLSEESWLQTCGDLAVDLPWHTRRANLLVGGMDLASIIGQPVTVGEVRLWIHGETKPCKLMDEQHMGLRPALQPATRGGVYGQALCDGVIRVGDRITVDTATP